MTSSITPRTNTRLIGHESALSQLQNDLERGKLAHGWLISGPRGIGKATLAYRFARMLLGAPPEDDEHPVFKRTVAGSHSDFLVLEPIFDEKKEERARDISVEQAREIAEFLSLTPGEGQWRVVIIDSIDALGTSAANAILKILEEPPPQTVLLLISHAPGRLLPTIRSRCRSLKLAPLTRDQFVSVMRHVSPALESSDIRALAQLSSLSPGVALELYEQESLDIYEQMLAIVGQLPAFEMAAIHGFAERIGTGKVHTNWQLFTQLALCMLSRAALHGQGMRLEPVCEAEAEALTVLGALHSPDIWAERWQQVMDEFSLAQRLHLDYKQAVITFFHSLPTEEGFHIGLAA